MHRRRRGERGHPGKVRLSEGRRDSAGQHDAHSSVSHPLTTFAVDVKTCSKMHMALIYALHFRKEHIRHRAEPRWEERCVWVHRGRSLLPLLPHMTSPSKRAHGIFSAAAGLSEGRSLKTAPASCLLALAVCFFPAARLRQTLPQAASSEVCVRKPRSQPKPEHMLPQLLSPGHELAIGLIYPAALLRSSSPEKLPNLERKANTDGQPGHLPALQQHGDCAVAGSLPATSPGVTGERTHRRGSSMLILVSLAGKNNVV